jgi:hypothetical protein
MQRTLCFPRVVLGWPAAAELVGVRAVVAGLFSEVSMVFLVLDRLHDTCLSVSAERDGMIRLSANYRTADVSQEPIEVWVDSMTVSDMVRLFSEHLEASKKPS